MEEYTGLLKSQLFRMLEREVRANVVYRSFCRVGTEKVTDGKTLVRLGLRSFTAPLGGEGHLHLLPVLLPLAAHRVPRTTRRSLSVRACTAYVA